MRTLILFLLAATFFLLGGESKLYAASNLHWSAQKIGKLPQHPQKVVEQHQPVQVIKHSSLTDKNQEVLNFEDESEDFHLSKKVVLLVSYFVLLASITYLGSLRNKLKIELPFCTHFSYLSSFKFILQRVLRI